MGCSSVNNGGESGGKVRVVAKAAGNAIAMAAATVVAGPRWLYWWFGNGSGSGGNNDGSG